jgi:hypothetical protein
MRRRQKPDAETTRLHHEENVKVVHGNLSSSRDWQSGKYKVETQINGARRERKLTVE